MHDTSGRPPNGLIWVTRGVYVAARTSARGSLVLTMIIGSRTLRRLQLEAGTAPKEEPLSGPSAVSAAQLDLEDVPLLRDILTEP